MRAIDLLTKDRVDGVIEFSSVFASAMATKHLSTEAYSFHSLAGHDKFVGGYIVCSKGDIGEQVMQLFESVLRTPELQSIILREHKRVFPKEVPFLVPELERQLQLLLNAS